MKTCKEFDPGILRWIVIAAACLLASPGFGQGIVRFNNRVIGAVDAPVTVRCIAPTTNNYVNLSDVAAIYGRFVVGLVDADTGVVYRTTTFRTDTLKRIGYINPIEVDIGSGVKNLRMAAWWGSADTAGYKAAKSAFESFGESEIFRVRGTLPPADPAILVGLKGFDISPAIFLEGCAEGSTQESRYAYTKTNGEVTITRPNCLDDDVTIPATLDGLPVTAIGGRGFGGLQKLKSITLPSTLIHIGGGAFEGCPCLRTVILNEGLKTIGGGAFWECEQLFSITIPNTVTSIGGEAFWGCRSLNRLFFEGDAPTLGDRVFLISGGISVNPAAKAYYLAGTTGWGPTFGGIPAKLWNPQIVKTDGKFGVSDGKFNFTLSGAADVAVVVEASDDLMTRQWTAISTNTFNVQGEAYFADPGFTLHPSRFYRFRPL